VRLSCVFEFFFVVPSCCGVFATVFARKIHLFGAFQISDAYFWMVLASRELLSAVF